MAGAELASTHGMRPRSVIACMKTLSPRARRLILFSALLKSAAFGAFAIWGCTDPAPARPARLTDTGISPPPDPLAGARRVVFLSQPRSTVQGVFLAPVRVSFETDDGRQVSAFARVTLSLSGGTPGAQLLGPATAWPGPNGLVEFPMVYIDSAGTGFRLVASGYGVRDSALSQPFDVMTVPQGLARAARPR
jgi:hypothetical protein